MCGGYWLGTHQAIRARTRAPGGSLGTIDTLSDAGQDAFLPQVAMSERGAAAVVWRRSDGTHTRIQLRARTALGAYSAVQTLSDAGQHADLPQVAVRANGDVVIVWQRFDGAQTRVQARRRSADGNLGPVVDVSPPGQTAAAPEVTLDPGGHALVVWHNASATGGIYSRRLSLGGVLGPIQRSSPSGAFPQIATDGNGNSLIVWLRSLTHQRVQSRTRSAAGVLGPVANLSPAGEHASNVSLGVDASGKGVLTWSRGDSLGIARVESRYELHRWSAGSGSDSIRPVETCFRFAGGRGRWWSRPGGLAAEQPAAGSSHRGGSRAVVRNQFCRCRCPDSVATPLGQLRHIMRCNRSHRSHCSILDQLSPDAQVKLLRQFVRGGGRRSASILTPLGSDSVCYNDCAAINKTRSVLALCS